MDGVEPKWVEFKFPEEATVEDFFEFMKFTAKFSVNVNVKDDPKLTAWISKHKNWFMKGGE